MHQSLDKRPGLYRVRTGDALPSPECLLGGGTIVKEVSVSLGPLTTLLPSLTFIMSFVLLTKAPSVCIRSSDVVYVRLALPNKDLYLLLISY